MNGKSIRMELDTGSAVSVMSQHEFEKHFKTAKLKPSPVKLKTYTGEPIIPLGVMPVTVKYNNQQSELDLYIVLQVLCSTWFYRFCITVHSKGTGKSAGWGYSGVSIRNRNSEAYQGEGNLG